MKITNEMKNTLDGINDSSYYTGKYQQAQQKKLSKVKHRGKKKEYKKRKRVVSLSYETTSWVT